MKTRASGQWSRAASRTFSVPVEMVAWFSKSASWRVVEAAARWKIAGGAKLADERPDLIEPRNVPADVARAPPTPTGSSPCSRQTSAR